MFAENNNVSLVNKGDMDTDPFNSVSDCETVKDKVKLVKVNLPDFNKNTVQCWECENTFQMDTPTWGISQMNTKKIQCKICMKFFLIKATLKAEPKYDNGTLKIESSVTIYTAGLETGIKNIRPCISCKIKKEIITVPAENLRSEEWFICKCGKNQCAVIESVSQSEQLPLTARKSRKKNKHGSEAFKTFHAPSIDDNSGQILRQAPLAVHGTRLEMSSGGPDPATVQQAPSTRPIVGKIQTTLDAWKVAQPTPLPPVADKFKTQKSTSADSCAAQNNQAFKANQPVTRGAKRQRTGTAGKETPISYTTTTQTSSHIPNIFFFFFFIN
jgi:hypothetical protein